MADRIGVLVLLTLAGPALAQTPQPGYTQSSASIPGGFTTIVGTPGTVRLTPADPPASTLDDRFYATPIGFGFRFYERSAVTTAYVSTNGFLSFGGTTNTSTALNTEVSASYTHGTFNTNLLPVGDMQVDRGIIAPLWSDLRFEAGRSGGVYTLNRAVGARQELVVEWNRAVSFGDTVNFSPLTFQAVLRDDGRITFNYGTVGTSDPQTTQGKAATVGLHDLGGTADNTRFVETSLDSATLYNDLQYTYTVVPVPEPAWLGAALLVAGGLTRILRRRG